MKKTTTTRDDKFYEKLAPLYHLKVDWDKRLPKEKPLFDLLFADFDISAVCDLGCGDGGHAEEIIKRGAAYVGIDNSSEMITMAKRHYEKRQGIRFIKGSMLRLPCEHNGMFDLVLLLGNTLPHVLSKRDLAGLFRSVNRVLEPKGRFVLQTVNPGLLRKKQVHFLAPKLAESRLLFTPLYAREGDFWNFHMPVYVIEEGKMISSSDAVTKLRFWNRSEIAEAAKQYFRTTRTFGSASLSPYSAAKSDNLILILEKR